MTPPASLQAFPHGGLRFGHQTAPLPDASTLSCAFNSALSCFHIQIYGGTGTGQEGCHLGRGLLLPAWPWGVPGAAGEPGGGGIKSRRENILQQVQLATGLNGCQPAWKSQTHLCSSVGHQMGPGLVFWAGVSLGGWGEGWGGWLPWPGTLTPRLHSPVCLAQYF